MLRSRPGVARSPSRSRGSCRAWRCAAASSLSHFFTSASGARRCGTKSRPTKRDTSSSACANTYSLPRATTGTVRTPISRSSSIACGRAPTSIDSNSTPRPVRNSFTLTQLEQPCRQYTRRWPMGLRRDRDAAHPVFVYQLFNKTRLFHIVGEYGQVFRRGRARPRRADRLLHARHLAVEHARARQLLGVGDEPWLEAGERLELLVDEQLVRSLDPLRACELSFFQ